MGSVDGDQFRCVWEMNLAREKFLCPLDLDWNMRELGRRILKKVQEKGRREDDRGKVSLLMGIREVTTW